MPARDERNQLRAPVAVVWPHGNEAFPQKVREGLGHRSFRYLHCIGEAHRRPFAPEPHQMMPGAELRHRHSRRHDLLERRAGQLADDGDLRQKAERVLDRLVTLTHFP
jgi:hypothetical protein